MTTMAPLCSSRPSPSAFSILICYSMRYFTFGFNCLELKEASCWFEYWVNCFVTSKRSDCWMFVSLRQVPIPLIN